MIYSSSKRLCRYFKALRSIRRLVFAATIRRSDLVPWPTERFGLRFFIAIAYPLYGQANILYGNLGAMLLGVGPGRYTITTL
jgi:hypothetical protein